MPRLFKEQITEHRVQILFIYSSGQAAVYSYVPVLSLYSVFVGAYIIHEPDGDNTRQLSAVPADVYPLGHELSAIVICSSATET